MRKTFSLRMPAFPKAAMCRLLAISAILLIAPACRHEKGAAPNANRPPLPAVLEAGIHPGEATIGDRITYTLSLSTTPAAAAKLPELSASPEGLTPVASGHSGPVREKGRITEKRWITYRADRVGAAVFPPVKMRYTLDGVAKEMESPAVTLRIASVLPRTMTDIHGLKPLETPKRGPLMLLGAALLLPAAAVAAWLLWKKRKRPGPVAAAALSPHEEASRRLRELEAGGLLARGDFKKYYFLLSEIFRKYLEQRFQFPAAERTTEEILVRLPALEAAEARREDIRVFLQNTDPVKFAGAGCSREEALAETDRVRSFVAETRPRPPEPAEEKSHVAV
jgi:hypothetical protein